MNDILDDILYEDKEMILLHKPGGIAVQTARLGQKDLVSMLKNYRAGKNEDPYIGVVHWHMPCCPSVRSASGRRNFICKNERSCRIV